MSFSCPRCGAYLLDHPDPKLKSEKWKKCPGCGYCRKEWPDKKGDEVIDGLEIPKPKDRHKSRGL